MTCGPIISLALGPASSGLSPDQWVGGDRRLGEAATTHFRLELAHGDIEASDGIWRWAGRRHSIHRDERGRPKGLVLGFMNAAPEVADEFEDWYETEHLPRLAGVEGVLTACRFRATRGFPVHLAVYGLVDLDVSHSEAWIAAARTPWAARMRRFTRDYRRLAFSRD